MDLGLVSRPARVAEEAATRTEQRPLDLSAFSTILFVLFLEVSSWESRPGLLVCMEYLHSGNVC